MAIVPNFIPGGEATNAFINQVLDGGEVGIETIRSVDYAAQYLWTIDFISGPVAPKPFDRFFPASDITFQSAISNNHTFEMAQGSFSIPRNSGHKTIDITFFDNESHELQQWMTEWINIDMYNGGNFVSGISDTHSTKDSGLTPKFVAMKDGKLANTDVFNTSVFNDGFNSGFLRKEPKTNANAEREVAVKRMIRIVLLDRFKDEALVYNYSIIPNGEINVVGSQSSEASVFNMKFDIVEQLGKDKNKGTTGTKRFIKTALQRFI